MLFYKPLTALAVIEIGISIAIRYSQYPIGKKQDQIFGNMTNYTYIALLVLIHVLAKAGQAFFMYCNRIWDEREK